MSDPVTRQEQLLSAIAAGGDIISPVTREEMYLAYMAGDTSIVLPEPVTRKEQFLYQACLNGDSGGAAPVIQPISITENGTYEAPYGVDGYSPVTVAIESGVGSNIATGSFKISLSNPNIKVTHGLGVVPNFAICYRSMSKAVTSRQNTFIYLAKLNGSGTMAAVYPTQNINGFFSDNGNAGKDTTHAITDIPTDYAPYVGAYGATENEITFGFNYDSSRNDTYFCFDSGWDTYYWIVGVM